MHNTHDIVNDILFLGSRCLFVFVILQITILNTIEKCTLVSAQQRVNAFCLCDCYVSFYVRVCVCVFARAHNVFHTCPLQSRLEQKDPWFYGNSKALLKSFRRLLSCNITYKWSIEAINSELLFVYNKIIFLS